MTQGGMDIRTARRVACPSCRSNNFLGRPQCWQCGASLPPPEAAAPTAAAPAAAQPAFAPAQASPTPSPARRVGVIVGGAAACILVGLTGAVMVSGRSHPSSGGNRAVAAQQAELERMRQQMLHGSDLPQPSSATSSDPTQAAARREIDRLRREAGMADPHADSSGQVHLQGGGSMSADEWRKTQRALGGL